MASKRRLRRQACEGKQRFSTNEAAAIHSSHVYHVAGKRLHPYRCQFCNEFHLGHMPSGVRTAINQRGA